MSFTPSSSLPGGRSFGRYELLFRVASGGMAEVYAGRVRGEAGFQKLVAVKCMLRELSDDPEFVQMFLDEARLAAHISSPHVVSTLDLGRSDDSDESLYIVMELVVGTSLAKVLRRRAKRREAVPVGIAVELLAQAAQGLHDAHEARTPVGAPLHIVHRDVSPQNILLGVDGRVRLTDFGVARAVHRITQTVAGRIKGKFAYCSPEQLDSQPLDRRSDVFSLGVVAWEMLAMQRLFAAEHPLETMERVKTMPIPSLASLRDDVPQAVSEVVDWALSREPERRPASARAFGEALTDALGDGHPRTDREDLVAFLEDSAGTSLERMRANLKAALAQRSDFDDLAQLEVAAEQGAPADDDASGVTTKALDEMAPTRALDQRHPPVSEEADTGQFDPQAAATVVDPQGSSWLRSTSDSESASMPWVAGAAPAAQARREPTEAAAPRGLGPWIRRHPLALVLGAMAVAALVVAGAVMMAGSPGDDAAAASGSQAPGGPVETEGAEGETAAAEGAATESNRDEATAEASREPGEPPESQAPAATAQAAGEQAEGAGAAETETTDRQPDEAEARAAPSPAPRRAARRRAQRPSSSRTSSTRRGTAAEEGRQSQAGSAREAPEPAAGPSLMGLDDFERDLEQ